MLRILRREGFVFRRGYDRRIFLSIKQRLCTYAHVRFLAAQFHSLAWVYLYDSRIALALIGSFCTSYTLREVVTTASVTLFFSVPSFCVHCAR